MKKILLTLAIALVAAPGFISETALAAPVNVTVENAGPVEDLIKLLDKLTTLTKIRGDKMTAEQMAQVEALASKIQAMQEKYSSYKLTDADREALVKWAKRTNEKMGEKLTAEDLAEMRKELNGFTTFGELTADLDLF